jgi:serine/threonine-protein kinase
VLSAQEIVRSSGRASRRYEPIAQIGRGGMAEVLLTMMHAGGGVRRLAVLKRIVSELATDPDFIAMFLDEARLSLRLSHANVVQTHEVLVDDNELAIAMEYLDGQPLTRVLNRLLRGPNALGLASRLRIVTSVLAGLEHAHTLTDLDGTPLGVVHRDVSPQNVFVTYDGQIKLVDFGVAKTKMSSHRTRPGAIKGKLAYMAPEQLQSDAVDRRADLFSVGVVLWEMLAQRRMWQGKTEVDIVGHLASGKPLPPLPVLSEDVPTDLDAICTRALEPDPARRYQTAAEMELDLERVLVGSADSHARNLGKVVSLAFATERAERQAVIERCLRQSTQQAKAEAPAVKAAPLPKLPTIDVSLEGIDDEPPVRTPRPAVTPPPAAPVAREPMRVDATPHALRFWRRVAVAGIAATVLTLLLLVVSRHGRDAGNRVATAGPIPVERAPAPAPVAAPSVRPAPPAAERPRRRHRAKPVEKPVDEDATLPPTETEPANDQADAP